MCGFISGSSIRFHWPTCLFLCQCHEGFITNVLYFSLKAGTDGDFSRSSFIIQDYLSYPGSFLFFHVKLRLALSMSVRDGVGVLTHWICRLHFGKMAIFTMLILLVHEHGRSFHLMIFPSFILQRFEVLVLQIFHCLVRVTQRYFILPVAIVKGVVYLIPFSAHLLLV